MADIDDEGGAIMIVTKTFLDGAFSQDFPQPFGYGAIYFLRLMPNESLWIAVT